MPENDTLMPWQRLCIKERQEFERRWEGMDFRTTKNYTKFTSHWPHPLYVQTTIAAMWEGWWSHSFSYPSPKKVS